MRWPFQRSKKNMEEKTTTSLAMTEVELKEKVIKAIKTVYDPEIPVDVYELGLIYEVKIFPVNNVYILMTFNFSILSFC